MITYTCPVCGMDVVEPLVTRIECGMLLRCDGCGHETVINLLAVDLIIGGNHVGTSFFGPLVTFLENL